MRWRVIEYGVSALRGGRRMAVGSSGGTGATAPTRARRSAGTRARRSAATARTRSPRSAATAGWAPTAEPCLAGTAPPPTAGPEGTGGQGAVAGGAWPGAGGEGACWVACGMRRYGTLGSQIGAGHVGLGYGAGPHGSGLGGAGGLAATIGTVGRVAGTSSNRLGGELEGWRVDHWWVGRGVGGRGSDRSPVPMYVRKPCGVVGCWLCLEVGPQGSGEGCGGRAGRRPAEALAAPRSAVSPAPTAATAR